MSTLSSQEFKNDDYAIDDVDMYTTLVCARSEAKDALNHVNKIKRLLKMLGMESITERPNDCMDIYTRLCHERPPKPKPKKKKKKK
ncbi:hypothetical protein [Veronia pacifica]|uniref:Uncharacterized protein n=1 Tax=Veronia pacifica TaxID=1080227 RepID=A0A1C3ESM6_9GAMM|nr:hypothetical protein [Veronia pacifica]ODA36206.1 hypothetical protein A8L45_00970 [Veronia pacifica]